MSLDETLFRFFYRAAKSVLKGKADEHSGGVELEPLRAQLSIVASAVAEQRVTIEPDLGAGSIQRPRLRLPARMIIASEPIDNARCYLARTVRDATVMRLQLGLSQPASPVARVLAAALVAPAVQRDVRSELPGALGLLEWCAALERTRAGDRRPQDAASQALDALVRARMWAEQPPQLSPAGRDWLARALAMEPSTAHALDAAVADLLPFVASARFAPLVAWGGIDADGEDMATPLQATTDDEAPQRGGSEKELRTPERLRRIQLGDNPLDDNPLVHSFEKLHTAEEYQGGKKRADGDDEMDEHSEAIDELDLREVTRTRERANSYGRSNARIEGEVADAKESEPIEKAVLYDEWDGRSKRYRTGWCSVYEQPAPPVADPVAARAHVRQVLRAGHGQLQQMSAELSRVRTARVWRSRQPEGPDVDVDAMIERHATLRSGHQPTDKLYLSRRRHTRDLATLLLVDASLSTDAWVDNRRVLDVAKNALILLGEVLSDEEIPTAVAAFSSQTRKHCTFTTLKDFEEPWHFAQLRVANLVPEGYTRIGPALRHATTLLANHPARARLLLLLSDAKPTDYDRYEGRYGVEDVRKALREAEEREVKVFALAIDRKAGEHLPAMFGRSGFELLPHPDALARALTGRYSELLR